MISKVMEISSCIALAKTPAVLALSVTALFAIAPQRVLADNYNFCLTAKGDAYRVKFEKFDGKDDKISNAPWFDDVNNSWFYEDSLGRALALELLKQSDDLDSINSYMFAGMYNDKNSNDGGGGVSGQYLNLTHQTAGEYALALGGITFEAMVIGYEGDIAECDGFYSRRGKLTF